MLSFPGFQQQHCRHQACHTNIVPITHQHWSSRAHSHQACHTNTVPIAHQRGSSRAHRCRNLRQPYLHSGPSSCCQRRRLPQLPRWDDSRQGEVPSPVQKYREFPDVQNAVAMVRVPDAGRRSAIHRPRPGAGPCHLRRSLCVCRQYHPFRSREKKWIRWMQRHPWTVIKLFDILFKMYIFIFSCGMPSKCRGERAKNPFKGRTKELRRERSIPARRLNRQRPRPLLS